VSPAAWGLAGVLIAAVIGLISAVVTRRPNSAEVQVVNDGSWEKLTAGWVTRTNYLDGQVTKLTTAVEGLQALQEADVRWKADAISFIRSLLQWGHDAGLTDPPEPPEGLELAVDP